MQHPAHPHPFVYLKRLAQGSLLGLASCCLPLGQAQSAAELNTTPNATPNASPNATSTLPNLGDSSDLTPAAERQLGDRIAKEMYRDPDYIDDPVLTDYVQGIWQALLAAARQRGELTAQLDQAFAWDILMGRDRSVNAFALPGGYFGLHLGLLAIVSSKDELASVLAHELSHVTQRHIARSLSRQTAQAPWVMGALILGLLAASKNPGAAQATIVGTQAAAMQNQLNYSRDMEREADRIGFAVETQAGFAPQGFVSMFEKLQHANRLNDTSGFPYLRSHPVNTERIADMQSRIQQSNPALRPKGSEVEPLMMAARARVLSNPGVDALRQWEQEASPSHLARLPEAAQVGALYGAAFAALKQRNFTQLKPLLGKLNQYTRNDAEAARLVRLLAIDTALVQGDAISATELAKGLQDKRRASLLARAQTDSLAGRQEAAAQSLQSWLAEHPRDAGVWQQLAAIHTAMGRSVAAVRDEAEAHVAQLDYAGALARFRAAQDLGRNSPAAIDRIEASIIDTRTRQMEALLREQAFER
ncbi:MAG: M48 family metalloprotease [Rhodoferax sp.]|nr:M48 family metalloprotease [Rhodoferax sp.]